MIVTKFTTHAHCQIFILNIILACCCQEILFLFFDMSPIFYFAIFAIKRKKWRWLEAASAANAANPAAAVAAKTGAWWRPKAADASSISYLDFLLHSRQTFFMLEKSSKGPI